MSANTERKLLALNLFSLCTGPAEATFVPYRRSKTGTTNLPEGTVHILRDNASKPSPEELAAKVEQMSIALPENADDESDGVMLGVLAVPSWMTPSDFLAFVAPAVDGIGHLRIIRCVLEQVMELTRLVDIFLLDVVQGFRPKPVHCDHQVSQSSRCI